MEKIKISPSVVIIGGLIIMIMDQLCLLLGAGLIGAETLSAECSKVWGILSLTVAALAAGVLGVGRNGTRVNTYVTAIIYFLILCLGSMLGGGVPVSLSSAVKWGIALLCGAFLGNSVGGILCNKITAPGRRSKKKA